MIRHVRRELVLLVRTVATRARQSWPGRLAGAVRNDLRELAGEPVLLREERETIDWQRDAKRLMGLRR